mgnify:CR=1 FL=1
MLNVETPDWELIDWLIDDEWKESIAIRTNNVEIRVREEGKCYSTIVGKEQMIGWIERGRGIIVGWRMIWGWEGYTMGWRCGSTKTDENKSTAREAKIDEKKSTVKLSTNEAENGITEMFGIVRNDECWVERVWLMTGDERTNETSFKFINEQGRGWAVVTSDESGFIKKNCLSSVIFSSKYFLSEINIWNKLFCF